ncbi:MAG: ATP-binding protein [Cyanobacteria bacterium J06636_16]
MSQPEEGSQSPVRSLVESGLIHAPGSIQPHGLLFVLAEPKFEIVQTSNNTEDYLGLSPERVLGRSLQDWLDADHLQLLQTHRPQRRHQRVPVRLSLRIQDRPTLFSGGLFRNQDALVLELEPLLLPEEDSLTDVQMLLGGAIAQIKQTHSLDELLAVFVDEVRKLTGFDRVHVYQFDEHGAGEVVAEVKQDALVSYLGLHFPAHDIPEQAKQLYRLGLLRYIPDLTAQPVVLIPTLHPQTKNSLDLSPATLRSVDACCVEYHQNMGVAALLVAPILKEQTLWGLLTCHHKTPKHISQSIRAACEIFTQMVASELESKLRQADLIHQTQIHALQSDFLQSIAEADNFIEALIKPEMRLLGLVEAQGAAVCLGNNITLLGRTPTLEQTQQLIEWADQEIHENIYHTNVLSQVYLPAQAFTDTASGLLFLRISKVQRHGIFWFRSEVLQTVDWGGNPDDSIQVDAAGEPILCPRNSFASWQEVVRNTSLPWHSLEINSAIDLRNALVGIVLKKADELAKLNQELQHSNRQLASFAYAAAHDLKEPLRGIYNYASVLLEDYTQILDQEGLDYLTEIQAFSQRMETLINALLRVSQLRQTHLKMQLTDLNEVLENAVEVVHASRPETHFEVAVPRSLPPVLCDLVLVNEVFRNLISNAVKYNDQPQKWIEVGYQESEAASSEGPVNPATSNWTFYVRDNGIGISETHLTEIFKLFKRLHPQELYGGGAGIGLAIVHQIIERHGGKIWVESAKRQGSTFYFTLSG